MTTPAERSPAYVDTFYSRTLDNRGERPELDGSRAVDVCIIGGGFAGLTAALELARRGRSVVVLEAQAVGWGASGRNGGFVSPGYSRGLASIEAVVGPDHARKLHALSIEGMRIVAGNIEELGVTAARPQPGIIRAIRYDDPDGLRRTRDRLAREHDYHLEFWTTAQTREVLASEKYHQALYDPSAFHIHPLNYARALAAEIERLGGLVFERSRAVSLETAGAIKTVRTQNGEVRAPQILITCGGYTDQLVPRLRRSHLPIATYVLTTEPAPDLIARTIRTKAAVGDDRRAGDYYRVVDEGQRVLWGGRITTRTSEPRALAAMLRRTMTSTYPQFRDLEVAVAWTGLMSYARHLMPQMGELSPGVWYCMGFGGHGVNTTAIGGRLMAEGISGEADRYRLFAPFGLVWAGGPFGVAAAQATYWTYQGMDWWRERRQAG